ncbi:MAG: hypothetical protein HQ464_06095 [Planctomycetes bacterium]|nr:hypothetical protein [Planctomycetota bacterium]
MNRPWLLVAVPLAIGLEWSDAHPTVVFCASLVAILPLVGIMGTATERLASKLGPTIGGLLNSTLNNLPELIIGGVALAHGLAGVVKASLTGAILANLLVSFGLALVTGGLRHGEQHFAAGSPPAAISRRSSSSSSPAEASPARTGWWRTAPSRG